MHVIEDNLDYLPYSYDPAMPYTIDRSEMRDQFAQRFRKQHNTLQQHAQDFRNQGLNCKALMVQGETVKNILSIVEKLSIDFMVVGSHGKGAISQLLLGSTSKNLIKKSSIPIYLIPVDKSE